MLHRFDNAIINYKTIARYSFGLFFLSASIHAQNIADNHANMDPYEGFNRHVYAFNETVDKIFLKPIAKTYQTVLPAIVRARVTCFFNNLDMIPTMINDGFQGKPDDFGRDTWRFLINSTIGIAGLFDPATRHFHLSYHHQDFGLTLSRWGYKNSNYLMLPIIGPSTIRDFMSLPVNYASSVSTYVDDTTAYALLGGNLINTRSNLLNYDSVLNQAFDPYVAVRSGYFQKRSNDARNMLD